MDVKNARVICFSPTGTTRKILDNILLGLDVDEINITDLTHRKTRGDLNIEIIEDIVLIGVPVYAERVPYFLIECLKKIKGNGRPAVVVCVYGNIGFGRALSELEGICINNDLNIIAGGTFIGEHSFSNEILHVAEGRPDNEDLIKAQSFGAGIRNKMVRYNSSKEASIGLLKNKLSITARIVPNNGERIVTRQPDADRSLCIGCGICWNTCPMEAIGSETCIINEKHCIRCFSCVKKCPFKARKIIFKKKPVVLSYLNVKGKNRKEPRIYI